MSLAAKVARAPSKPSRRPSSFRRMAFMPDPDFAGSWIPDPERRKKLLTIETAIVRVLTASPGIGMRKLRAAVRGLVGRCTDADTDAAICVLGPAVRREIGFRVRTTTRSPCARFREKCDPASHLAARPLDTRLSATLAASALPCSPRSFGRRLRLHATLCEARIECLP